MLQGSQSSLSEQLGIRVNNVDCADYVTMWSSRLENHERTYDFKMNLVSWSMQFSFLFTNDLFKSHVFQPLSMKRPVCFPMDATQGFLSSSQGHPRSAQLCWCTKTLWWSRLESNPSRQGLEICIYNTYFRWCFQCFHADCFFWCVGTGGFRKWSSSFW